jgi:hypothetical protein
MERAAAAGRLKRGAVADLALYLDRFGWRRSFDERQASRCDMPESVRTDNEKPRGQVHAGSAWYSTGSAGEAARWISPIFPSGNPRNLRPTTTGAEQWKAAPFWLLRRLES